MKARYSDEDRTGLSATTFIMLCIWLGPDRAVFLITVTAILTVWFLACRRWLSSPCSRSPSSTPCSDADFFAILHT
jgi:hypothetical protein